MASFLVRIFLERSDYLAVVDGWGTVRSPTLRGVRAEAKRHVREIVDRALPLRTRIERVECFEMLRLWFDVQGEGDCAFEPERETVASCGGRARSGPQ